MKGLGYFIWQLETIKKFYTPEMLAELLVAAKVKWVSIKVGDGQSYYNQIAGPSTASGNDKELRRWMDILRAAGIAVGGWWYLRPYLTSAQNPGVQPGMIGERIEKLELDHMIYDVEGEWKQSGLNTAIDKALRVDVGLKFPGGFCSYRYPKLHAPLNFNRFLHNPTINFNAPQVYWIGAHNPAEQMDRSYNEYQAYGVDIPFVPMGAAFGATVGNSWWEPTTNDLEEFVGHCKERGWATYGFWSLDWVIKKGKYDWMTAISGAEVKPPEPPKPQLPRFVRVKNDYTNIRNAPVIAPMSDIGEIEAGSVLEVLAEQNEFYQVKTFVAKSVVTPE